MLNVKIIPEYILEDLIEREHTVEGIQKMSPYEAWKEYLEWHGLIGWAPTLLHALQSFKAAETNK